jgi:hypothetical protein
LLLPLSDRLWLSLARQTTLFGLPGQMSRTELCATDYLVSHVLGAFAMPSQNQNVSGE